LCVTMAANSGSLTLQTSGGTPKVLNNAEATQLLQRLRAAGAKVGENQTIKIQAIQTNPTTGVRQIVAIPIQTATSSTAAATSATSSPATMVTTGGGMRTASGSPLKVIRLPAGATTATGAGGTQIVTMSPAQLAASGGELPANVKVVKIPAGSASAAAFQTVSAAAGTPVSVASPGFAINQGGKTIAYKQVSAGQVVGSSPSKIFTVAGSGGSVVGGGTPISVVGAGGDAMAAMASRKRQAPGSDIDFGEFSSDAKRRKTEKGGKGLRHFSMKVCEKVQAKGSTSYNEVADELVGELTDPGCASPTDQQYDQKNIRRRVYDALNVLMAMNIISKEKKEIRWLGLPTNSVQEANGLEHDKTKRIERIKAKTQQLQDLILQQITFKNLVERNKEREKSEGAPPPPNSSIQLPFIIVNTSKETVIDCSISNDKREYLFNFDDTFEIHDDMEVLKRMGLGFGLERGQVKPEDLEKAKKMVPRALEQYVTQLAEKGPGAALANMPKVSSPRVLRELSVESTKSSAGESPLDVGGGAQSDSDSEIDIN